MFHAKTLFVPGLFALLLAACEFPPVESTQTGFRGTAMADVQNTWSWATNSTDAFPDPLPQVPAVGPTAGATYQNVQVLGDLSIAQFTRLMTAMTAWVSPEEGCNYCHNPGDLASDDIYTKVVSRRMLQMTQHINANWSDHVGGAGVNCYTCHRGNPIPEYLWYAQSAGETAMGTYAGNRFGQNLPIVETGYSSLPVDAVTRYLTGDVERARVIPTRMHPEGQNYATIQETEDVYSVMFHISGALDANCTYCHNSASFQSWEQSTPQRATAYHGIEMARDLNNDYLLPLRDAYPEERLGPLGDAPKVSCLTCHQGQKKPLGGADAVSAYPSLTE